MTKDYEYRWMARVNAVNLEWLESFLTGPHNECSKRLAWLRLMGLIETWDIYRR